MRHQRHVPELFCLLHTALGEARSGEEEEVLVLIREQLAAGDEHLQDGKINLLHCPFALGEKCGVLVLLAHDIDLGLGPAGGVRAPPAAEGFELHRRPTAEQQLPEVLLAELLEHLAHILGQMRLDALVDEVRRAARGLHCPGQSPFPVLYSVLPRQRGIVTQREAKCVRSLLFCITCQFILYHNMIRPSSTKYLPLVHIYFDQD